MQGVIRFYNIDALCWVTWKIHCRWRTNLLGPVVIYGHQAEVFCDCVPSIVNSIIIRCVRRAVGRPPLERYVLCGLLAQSS